MRGLLGKTVRETWAVTLFLGILLLLVERLMSLVLPQLMEDVGLQFIQLPLMKKFVSALMGIDLEGDFIDIMIASLQWVHPVVLSLVWAHAIIFCTRWPTGEIDRGTIDVFLGLPISRRKIFLGESIIWLISGAVILLIGSIGYFLGVGDLAPEQRPEISRIFIVLINLYCMYLAVGGMVYFCSSWSNRRGRATLWSFTLVLGSFLLNFLAQFWTPAERLEFLSVMHYYQAATILRDGVIPWGDLAVLLTFGFITWGVAGEISARRSLCTT